MTDPLNPEAQDPEPQDRDRADAAPEPTAMGGPTDGDARGGVPAVFTTARLFADQDRGLDYALGSVEQLTLGLSVWLSDIDSDGSGRGQAATERARLLGRTVDQLLTMTTLVELSMRQRQEQGDLTTGWILLEQARQQFGWAAHTAGALRRAVAGEAVGLSEPNGNAVFADDGPSASLVLEYLLQRDLIPCSEYAGELLDMGEGDGVIPDPRPRTPFELVPLQMLSATVMQRGTVIADAMPRPLAERMAYGSYLAMLLDESAALLHEYGRTTNQRTLQRLAEVGREAADVLWQLTPGPLAVFPPREGGAVD